MCITLFAGTVNSNTLGVRFIVDSDFPGVVPVNLTHLNFASGNKLPNSLGRATISDAQNSGDLKLNLTFTCTVKTFFL